MLRLQGRCDEREGVSEALGDVTQRVRAIALVHEILYGAPSLAQVELSAYVPELVRGLRATLSRPSRVMTSLDIAPGLLLNPDEAVTCGMVLNELITNAIRHAFPHGNGGHIAIEGYPVGDGRIRVTVRDDGVGLGESVDWRRTDTLGLTLAVGLVENQLDGDITLEEGPGVALSFTFKALNPAISP
jgi:two-component sensor histidine kinase